MFELSSSARERIRVRKQALVIDLVRRRGNFWDAVHDIRCRWDIDAVAEFPPPGHPFGPHMPSDAPEYADLDEDGAEEWGAFIHRWQQELGGLYDNHIPEDCWIGMRFLSQVTWERFLSACVLFDPPDNQLEEYANRFQLSSSGFRDSEGGAGNGLSPYRMTAPPIRWMRDAGAAEDAMFEVFNRFVNDIIERHEKAPDISLADLIREAMSSPEFFAPVRESNEKNPTRPFIQVDPWHTESDIRNAFRMIRETQKARPRRGRPSRDKLRAVQCAIFADRYGWTEAQVGNLFGWNDYSQAGKYIRLGRGILGSQ